MLACPKCSASVPWLSILPRREEKEPKMFQSLPSGNENRVLARLFSDWGKTACGRCGAALELVPWMRNLGLGICLLLMVAPSTLLPRRYFPIVPSTLATFGIRFLELIWMALVLFVVFPRFLGLRMRRLGQPAPSGG